MSRRRLVVLAFNSDTNNTKLTADSEVLMDSAGGVVTNLVHNSTGNTLTFTASKWSNSRYIGFFRARRHLPGAGRQAERLVAVDRRHQDQPEHGHGLHLQPCAGRSP